MEMFSWRPFGDVPEISAQELHSLLSRRESVPQVLDVRTLVEWIECRIAGSINVPVTELKCKLASLKLDKNRPIVAVCGHAVRSIPTVRLLQTDGFEDVCQLRGGMLAWTEAQLPVVEGPCAPVEKANYAAPESLQFCHPVASQGAASGQPQLAEIELNQRLVGADLGDPNTRTVMYECWLIPRHLRRTYGR